MLPNPPGGLSIFIFIARKSILWLLACPENQFGWKRTQEFWPQLRIQTRSQHLKNGNQYLAGGVCFILLTWGRNSWWEAACTQCGLFFLQICLPPPHLQARPRPYVHVGQTSFKKARDFQTVYHHPLYYIHRHQTIILIIKTRVARSLDLVLSMLVILYNLSGFYFIFVVVVVA